MQFIIDKQLQTYLVFLEWPLTDTSLYIGCRCKIYHISIYANFQCEGCHYSTPKPRTFSSRTDCLAKHLLYLSFFASVRHDFKMSILSWNTDFSKYFWSCNTLTMCGSIWSLMTYFTCTQSNCFQLQTGLLGSTSLHYFERTKGTKSTHDETEWGLSGSAERNAGYTALHSLHIFYVRLSGN